MKTVGKQLEEARLAKSWTPELAARETKIKVERLRDLESDDFSQFSSPTYARGFVRTYARALGLDEYKILRQLDNKLPDDDSANIVNDNGGVAYLPETALPPRAAHRDYTGLYIVAALGAVVTVVIAAVLFEAYRVGELSHWLGGESNVTADAAPAASHPTSAPSVMAAEPVARALPVDSDTPPPITEPAPAPAATAAPAAQPVQAPLDASATGEPGTVAPRALPVDSSTPPPIAEATPPAALPVAQPVTPDAQPAITPPRALPVDPSELNNPPPASPVAAPVSAADAGPGDTPKAPLRALPVSPSELAADAAANTPPPAAPVALPAAAPAPASAPEMASSLPPVAPVAQPADLDDGKKPLVLTASQDSYVRVTNLDAGDSDKPVYAAVLKSGRSIAFSGHKFSINVGIPAAVDIKLDGVNYGPHDDGEAPETFTVQSHLQ
jgi:cytoskeletal protein RodZ